MNDRILFRLTLAILAMPIVIAAGCQERYRYPCQDPSKWELEMCKKPLCEVHRQCPDLIFKEDSEVVGIKKDQIAKPIINNTTSSKGCK
jgi:hypothetical protein